MGGWGVLFFVGLRESDLHTVYIVMFVTGYCTKLLKHNVFIIHELITYLDAHQHKRVCSLSLARACLSQHIKHVVEVCCGLIITTLSTNTMLPLYVP